MTLRSRSLREWPVILCAAALLTSQSARAADPANTDPFPLSSEADRHAPVDYGFGPGVKPWFHPFAGTAPGIPNGGPTAATQGAFAAPATWPIIPLHMVLMPNGKIMSYGTSETGAQGAQFIYDVWNPALGTGATSHMTLPNGTGTDIFCSGQIVLPGNGDVLITGGDLTISGKRNYSQNSIELFTPGVNTLTSIGQMQYPRWYPSLVALPNGEVLVLGGRTAPAVPATVPEVYNSTTGWRTLTGAASTTAFTNNYANWYYPRGFVNEAGSVLLVAEDGQYYGITTSGTGKISTLGRTTTVGSNEMPTLMYAPNQLLSVRPGMAPEMINMSGALPTATPSPGISQDRFWASGTVMADGRVLITGGSEVANQLQGVAYAAEIWNPSTNTWSVGASAKIARLYHSNAILLPDATVLTGGGGAPGPLINLNVEIYYPPYLYKNDGSGTPATRPNFVVTQTTASAGGTVTGTVGVGQTIGRITLVRTGSATHSTNLDQRLVQLAFTQTGRTVSAVLPPTTLMPNGYYLMFAFDTNGVPALGKTILID